MSQKSQTPKRNYKTVAVLVAVALMLGLSPMIYQNQVNRDRGENVKNQAKPTPAAPPSPPAPNGNAKVADRRMDVLHPIFRPKIEAWLAAARVWLKKKGYTLTVTETFRTPERQAFLHSQNKPGRWVTDRTGKAGDESFHQFGVALDFMLVGANGAPDWNTARYQELLKAVPLGKYGLETLAPAEWVHIQLGNLQRTANGGWLTVPQAFAKLQALGVKPNVLVGSSYTRQA